MSTKVPLVSLFDHLIFIVIRNDFAINILCGNKMFRSDMESNRWPYFCLSQVLCDSLDDVIQVSSIVLVFPLLYIEVNFVAFLIVIFVENIACWYIISDLLFEHNTSFIRPASTYILNSVSSTT